MPPGITHDWGKLKDGVQSYVEHSVTRGLAKLGMLFGSKRISYPTQEPVRLLALVEPPLPNTYRTGDGGLGRDPVRLLAHGLGLSSVLALGRVLA